MAAFSKKEIRLGEHVGDIIRELREESGMSRKELADAAQVHERYIAAFEDFRYQDLPGEVYAKNFLKSIARAFSINEHRLLDRYAEDTRAFPFKQILTPPTAQQEKRHLTPQNLRLTALLFVICIVLAYVGFELRGFVVPPALNIKTPQDNVAIAALQVTVNGLTDTGVSITINGAPVPVTDEGTFTANVDLTPGVNSLAIVAKHKFGRETRVVRNIFARP